MSHSGAFRDVSFRDVSLRVDSFRFAALRFWVLEVAFGTLSGRFISFWRNKYNDSSDFNYVFVCGVELLDDSFRFVSLRGVS